MTDLIERLTLAIFRQEGMPADIRIPAISVAHHGPATRSSREDSGDRAVERRNCGAAHVVALRIAMGQSLETLISAWAPAFRPQQHVEVHRQREGVGKHPRTRTVALWDYL